MTPEQEKAARIKYQDVVYRLCNLLDNRKQPCPDCTVDDLVPRVQALITAARTTGVLQPWVVTLGLRHQGVLMACARGCDSVPKEDATQSLARCLRGTILRSFDPKPTSFIEHVDDVELRERMVAVLKNLDHYPIHYIMHLMHGSEIIGYKWPEPSIRAGGFTLDLRFVSHPEDARAILSYSFLNADNADAIEHGRWCRRAMSTWTGAGAPMHIGNS